MLAAQLWHAAHAALPGLDEAIEAGELGPLRDWLRERVHRHGRTHLPREQMRIALGADLDPEPYLAFARARERSPSSASPMPQIGSPQAAAAIELEGLGRSYGGRPALEGVSLTLQAR